MQIQPINTEEISTLGVPDIDPRTSQAFGVVEEKEIVSSFAETEGLSAALEAPVKNVIPMQKSIMTGMDMENPANAVVRDSIEITRIAAQTGFNNTQMNTNWASYMNTGDESYRDKALEIAKENEKLNTGLPEDMTWEKSKWNESLHTIVQLGGQQVRKHMEMPSKIKEDVFKNGLVDTFKFLGVNAPLEIVFAKLDYGVEQLQGETMKEVSATGVDFDIAKNVSVGYGAISGLIDNVSELTAMLGGAAKGAIPALKGIAGESGTEGLQGIITNVAKIHALNLQAEREGSDPIEYTSETILQGLAENLRAGAIGGAGFAGAGKVASMAADIIPGAEAKALTSEDGVVEAEGDTPEGKYSAEAISAIRKKRDKTIAATEAANEREAKLKRQAEVSEASEAPVVYSPVTDDPIPLTDEEIQNADETAGVDGTEITEKDIDTALWEPDSTQAAADLLAKRDGKYTEPESALAQEFESVVRNVLPTTAEADSVMAVLNAASDALHIPLESYLSSTGLSIRDERQVSGVRAKGIVKGRAVHTPASAIEQAKTIIEIYESGDVSTVIHEIGHHFRWYLGNEQKQAANQWVGAGSDRWSKAQEEMWARTFEEYLQTGKAPTQELKTHFDQFKIWLSKIYMGLVSSRHPVNMSPEITKVFDTLLTDQGQTLASINENNKLSRKIDVGQIELEQLEQEPLERYVARHEAIDEVRAESAKERQETPPMSHEDQDMQEVELYLNELRGMFDRGDAFGEKYARASLKAVITRQRIRRNRKTQHKKLQKRIFKLLKRNQPKGSKARPSSKMSGPVQEVVVELFKSMKKVKTKKNAKAFLNMTKQLGPEEMIDLHPLAPIMSRYASAMNNESSKGLRELKSIENEIKELVGFGRAKSAFMQNYLKAKNLVADGQPAIIGGTDNIATVKKKMAINPTAAHQQKLQRSKWRKYIDTWTFGHEFIMGWDDLINTVTSYSNQSLGKSDIEKALDFYENQQHRETQIRETKDKTYAAFDSSYGIKSDYDRNAKFNADLKRDIDVGLGVRLTKTEARQWWMYMQDPAIDERLVAQGITHDSFDKLGNKALGVRSKIDAVMTDQDKSFSTSMMNWWNSDELYAMNDKVYYAQFGVHMPRIENYVPIRSESLETKAKTEKEENLYSQLKHDVWSRQQPDSTGRIKVRNESINARLSVTGDMGLFDSYNTEMAHFRAMTEQVRLANAVLRDGTFKTMVEYEYGSKFYGTLQEHLGRISANGQSMAANVSKLDKFRSNFVSSTLGLRLSVTMKQMFSSVQYWDNMPIGGYFDALSNPKQFKEDMKALWGSEFLKNRQLDRDLMEFTGSNEHKEFMLNPTVKNWMTANIKYGDKAAIAFGGAAYYRHLINAGMSPEAALVQVGRKSDKTQQSASETQRSTFQSRGTMAKFFTTYSSGPVQAQRQINNAFKGMLTGRIGYKKAIKTIFIYQMLVPSMYSLSASMIGADEDEWIREEWGKELAIANVLGPLGSVYTFGSLIANQGRKFLGLQTYRSTDMFTQVVDDVASLGAKVALGDIDDISLDDLARAMQDVSVMTGRPLPIQTITRSAQNIFEGNVKGTLLGKKLED